jgi:hypothetical protein
MKGRNMHTTREAYLQAALEGFFRSHFLTCGYTLPDNIRAAISFTSSGKRGHMAGECWHPPASADKHFEIFIRVDKADPIEVLGIFCHELVHTLLPPEAKHGEAFKEIAQRIGLEGKMRQAMPGPSLRERVHALAESLGPLPHASLNFTTASDVPKKQATRYLKAECCAACGYVIRITKKWAKEGLPVCPINPAHGILTCDIPDDEDDEVIVVTKSTTKEAVEDT